MIYFKVISHLFSASALIIAAFLWGCLQNITLIRFIAYLSEILFFITIPFCIYVIYLHEWLNMVAIIFTLISFFASTYVLHVIHFWLLVDQIEIDVE